MNRNILPLGLIFLVFELISIIKVGGAIGALNAILILFLDVALGIFIIKKSLKNMVANMMLNPLAMAKGKSSLMALSGILFIFPGFITDIIAIVLLVYSLFNLLFTKNSANTYTNQSNDEYLSTDDDNYTKGRTIDGTATHEDDEEKRLK